MKYLRSWNVIVINKNYLNMLGLANAARALVNGETLIKSISANKVELV